MKTTIRTSEMVGRCIRQERWRERKHTAKTGSSRVFVANATKGKLVEQLGRVFRLLHESRVILTLHAPGCGRSLTRMDVE